MENKENGSMIAITTIVILIVIVAFISLFMTGCVLNNENIIQYGQDDTMQQEQEQSQKQEGSLEATLNPPQVKLAG